MTMADETETNSQRLIRQHREERLMTCRKIAAYMEYGVITAEIDKAISELASLCGEVEDDILLDEGRAPGEPLPGEPGD